MEEKENHGPSNGGENESASKLSTINNRAGREPYLGFGLFPKNLRHVVGCYISNDTKDPTRRAFVGERLVTLCLSQHANLELGSCWHFGCLSHENGWKSSREVRIDKKYLINECESCLRFFENENSAYCPIVIKVLVVQLDLSSQNFSNALNDLQNTLAMLDEYLSSVQHVIFAIEKHTFCCFSFKDVVDNVTKLRQRIDRSLVLKQIFDDLRIWWAANQTLSTKLLLDHYILNDAKPESDKYLSKFVISLKRRHNRALFDVVDPILTSSKLKWIYSLKAPDDLRRFDQRVARRCHALHLDAFKYRGEPISLEHAFSLEDNPFIERIVIDSADFGSTMKLFRPQTPLTDATPRSALIELMLTGDKNTFDLTQLNSGYFPNLVHLCIIGGKITGHLRSLNVPRLKTLRIELGSEYMRSRSKVGILIREHTQRLIKTGLPWQVVATDSPGGWSLASYDELTPNLQDEEKEGSSRHSLPLIRELMLVMCSQNNAKEYQPRLNGNPSLEERIKDMIVGPLVWAPHCVQRITVYSTSEYSVGLEFKETIPGQIRILNALTCHNIEAVVDGTALPQLQSLTVNGGNVILSGTFPRLQTLSFEGAFLLSSPWQLDAPMLESFSCCRLFFGGNLSLRPELLPHFSFLRIEPFEGQLSHCPAILVDGDGPGLSRINHVVFGKGMAKSPDFDIWKVHKVSHLELTVDAITVPKCWDNEEWLCETLTINEVVNDSELMREWGMMLVRIPPRLPRVKKLTVTETNCRVLLDSEMPELTYCTVPTNGSLGGQSLKCPKLEWICFSAKLSESDKKRCLDRAMYDRIGAKPIWVYFADGEELKRMLWDAAPSAANASSTATPLEDGGNSSVSRE